MTCRAAWFARIRTSKASALRSPRDRDSLLGRLQASRMVALDQREVDLDEQRLASDGGVSARTAPSRASIQWDPLRDGATSASTARDRPPSVSPRVDTIGIAQAVPQGGADVVRFEIQFIEPRERGRCIRR